MAASLSVDQVAHFARHGYPAGHTRQRSAPDLHVNLVRGRDKEKFFPQSPPPAGPHDTQIAAASAYFSKLKSGEIPYNVR